MATVGEQLKAAREAQRLTVTQVADMTKIRSDHIRAIDSGNYDVFSAPVYIRGFVRTYATALKLDTTLILAQLNAELAETSSQTVSTFQMPQAGGALDTAMYHLSKGSRRMLFPIIVMVLIVGGVVGGVFYLNHRVAQNPLAGMGPGLYDGASTPGEMLPLPRR